MGVRRIKTASVFFSAISMFLFFGGLFEMMFVVLLIALVSSGMIGKS